MHSRTIFLTLHLLHRSLLLVVPAYEPKDKISLVGLCCLHLACAINDEIIPFTDLLKFLNNAYTSEEFATMCVKIMAALYGIVHTVNYWDFASCFEDLSLFLEDVPKCTYNPKITRQPLNLPTSKDVKFHHVYKKFSEKFGQSNASILNFFKSNVTTPYTFATIPAIVRPIIGQVPKFNCNDVNSFVFSLIHIYGVNTNVFYNRVGLIVRNPDCLQLLDFKTAINFYNLIKNEVYAEQLLPRLVKFDYKVHNFYPFEIKKVHPFRATLKD